MGNATSIANGKKIPSSTLDHVASVHQSSATCSHSSGSKLKLKVRAISLMQDGLVVLSLIGVRSGILANT
jgi:hypothetical protein